MPAQSSRAKAAKAKRQAGAHKYAAPINPAPSESNSDSDWEPTDGEGLAEESDDADAYGIMQLRFAKHFKKPLHKKDLVRQPDVSL